MNDLSDATALDNVAGWAVYMIRADDQRLYTGITNDVVRRWRQHSAGTGAKFFRGRKPQALVFVESGHDRVSALRREAAIKKLSRNAKLILISVMSAEALAAMAVIDAENKPPAIPMVNVHHEDVPAAKG